MSAAGVRRLLPVSVLACLLLAVMAASARSQPADGTPAVKDEEKVVLPVILPEFSPASTSKTVYPKWLPEGVPLPPGTPVWVPAAVLGLLGSVLFSGLVILSAWPRRHLPRKTIDGSDDQFCTEFLTLPKEIQAIFYHQLGQGERVLWAGKASSRMVRRNLGLVLLIGFSALSLFLPYGRAHEWEILAGGGLICFLTIGAAYISTNLPGVFMLTDRGAYAFFRVPLGDFIFTYDLGFVREVTVTKAWLLPRAGNVKFGDVRPIVQGPVIEGRAPEDDPGPGGFLRIDDPERVAQLIESVARESPSGAPSTANARPEEMFHFE